MHDFEFHPQWNSGWPIQVTTSFVSSLPGVLGDIASGITSAVSSALSQFIGSTTPDDPYISSLAAMGGGRTYMAAVSPWFFTHYGPSTYNKNVSNHSAVVRCRHSKRSPSGFTSAMNTCTLLDGNR